jgi:hypothetical protein
VDPKIVLTELIKRLEPMVRDITRKDFGYWQNSEDEAAVLAKSRFPLLPTVETCLGRRSVPSPYLEVRIGRMDWISSC